MARGSPDALVLQPSHVARPTGRSGVGRGRPNRWLLTFVCLAGGVAFVVTPFLWMLLGSFKPTYELLQQQGQTLWIAHPTAENYQRLFQEYDFGRYFLNSLLVATVTATV